MEDIEISRIRGLLDDEVYLVELITREKNNCLWIRSIAIFAERYEAEEYCKRFKHSITQITKVRVKNIIYEQ